jgi:hypothetical protein
MIHLFGLNAQELPARIPGIQVNTAFKTLHILQATQQATQNGTEIGAYILHYADGTQERIPVVYGENACNWWEFREPEQPSRAIVAWKGTNDIGEREKRPVRLFAMTWENPFPTKVIKTIDFESASTICDPFVVAITVTKN